jgi:hypothetical protein
MQFVDRMTRKRKLDRLIEQWIEYRDMVSRYGGQSGVAPEQEKVFLSLKATIAGLLPILQDSQPGAPNTEAQSNVRGMTDLMNVQLSLAGVSPGDDFLNRWHAHYLYLNKHKGQREHAPAAYRHHGGGVIPGAPASMPGDSYYKGGFARRYIRPLFDNWFTKFVVRMAVVAGLVLLVAKVLNVDLNQVPGAAQRTWSSWWAPAEPTTSGPVGTGRRAVDSARSSTVTHQDRIDQTVQGSTGTGAATGGGAGPIAARPGGGVRQDRAVRINQPRPQERFSVDGTDVFVPPSTPAIVPKAKGFFGGLIPRPVKDLFSPVTERYGVEVTVAMVGIGLLLVAYMLFGRAR